MWIPLVALVVGLTPMALDGRGTPAATPALQHVRTEQAAARHLIDEATARSAIVRELVATLDRSDLFAYVQVSPPTGRHRQAHLTFLTASPGARYVLIWINSTLASAHQVALLGHELQHAVEIAGTDSVVSPESLAAYYSTVGWETRRKNCYETDAARAVGRAILKELSTAPPVGAPSRPGAGPPGVTASRTP